jgi:hypothetical protein
MPLIDGKMTEAVRMIESMTSTATTAALEPALNRRDLVTHWGLSTFPGSGM